MRLDYLEQISSNQLVNNKNIYWGTNVPSSPNDLDLWFETTLVGNPSSGSQPWIYNATNGIWLSQPMVLPIPVIKLTTEPSSYKFYPVRTYGTNDLRVYIQYFTCVVLNLSSTSHSSTNYWDIEIYRTNSSGVFSQVWSSPSNTGFNFGNPSGLPANSPRHIQFTVEKFVDGKTWDIGVNYTKVGSPPSEGIEISSTIIVRFAR